MELYEYLNVEGLAPVKNQPLNIESFI